jgi:hypothetical protein
MAISKGFPVCYILNLVMSPKMLYLSELETHRNSFYIGEMRKKIEGSVFNSDSAKLKFVVAMLHNKAFVDDLEKHGYIVQDILPQKTKGF